MIISNIWKNKIHVPSHQPEYHLPKNANGNRETTHLFESEKSCANYCPVYQVRLPNMIVVAQT
jgi:hypothetical protein